MTKKPPPNDFDRRRAGAHARDLVEPDPQVRGETVVVKTREIAAVAKWAHPNETHRLDGVAFRDGTYVATDGTRLVQGPCTNAVGFVVSARCLLSAAAAQEVLYTGQEPTERVISLRPTLDGKVAIGLGSGGTLTVPCRAIGDFPTTEAIAKTTDRGVGDPSPAVGSRLVNPRFLAAMQEVDEGSGCSDLNGVTLVSWDPTPAKGESKPRSIVFKNSKGIRFYIMPMRLV